MSESVPKKETFEDILRVHTDLVLYTFDDMTQENKIESAIDEVKKGVRLWLQQKPAKKPSKLCCDLRTCETCEFENCLDKDELLEELK